MLFLCLCSEVSSNIDTVPRIGSITCGVNETAISRCSISYIVDCADFTTLAGAVCVPDNGKHDNVLKL